MKKLLIFDLDGTLVDSRRDLATGINLMRNHYALAPLDYEIISGYVGNGVRKLVERSLSDAPHLDIDEAVAVDKKFYNEHLTDETTLYPGVADGLRRLKEAGHAIALLTNKPGDPSRVILDYFGLSPLFDAVVGGGDVAALKPDPAGIELIMKQCGFENKGAVWMIGDHNTDLEVAERAEVRSAFVTYGIGHDGGFSASVVLDSFGELTQFFLQ